MSKTLLVVDDEQEFAQIIVDTFQQEVEQGLKIESVHSGTQAWNRIDTEPTTIKGVLIDLVVPELEEGLTLIEKLEKNYPNIKYVVYSAQVSIEEYVKHFKNHKNLIACIDKGKVSTKEVKNLIREDLAIPAPQATKKFDYDTLDSVTTQFLRQQAVRIRGLIRQNILEIGLSLLEVKQKLKHGNFINWIESEFYWSYSLAYKFMRVAEAFPKKYTSVNFTDLQFAPSALYLLAAVSVPEAARDEAVSRAQAGEDITYSTAQEIKRKYVSESDKTPLKETKPKEELSTLLLPSVPAADRELKDETTALWSSEAKEAPAQPTRERATPPPQLEIVNVKLKTKASPKIQDSDMWWQLDRHTLYWGSPGSLRFVERLPQNIALSLAFPPHRNWVLEQPIAANSSLALYRGYEDEAPDLFRQMIERALELYTEAGDLVVFSYLPDPELLRLVDTLDCCCYIAEPRWARCQEAIAVWQAQGGTVQRASNSDEQS
ncbi:MAG: DUF3102 domain-containing protein [Cyanophyceae cyanobacterium]